jgi:glutamate-1-semialdehyde aminotransferase
MAAMRATLTEVLTEDAYRHMISLSQRWVDGVEDIIATSDLSWHVLRLGFRAEYHFAPDPALNG